MTAPKLPSVKARCPRCGTLASFAVVDSKALRKMRTLCGLSLRELARRGKITPAFLSDIELGRRQPSKAVAAAIAHALEGAK